MTQGVGVREWVVGVVISSFGRSVLLKQNLSNETGPAKTWARILRGVGYTARHFNPDCLSQPVHRRAPQAKWIGFHKGDVKLHVLMRWECHDKRALFELLRQQTADAPVPFLREGIVSAFL